MPNVSLHCRQSAHQGFALPAFWVSHLLLFKEYEMDEEDFNCQVIVM